MHYHVLWKDVRGIVNLLCVKSGNAAAAVRVADDYLGESLFSIVSLVPMETPYWECDAADIKRHLEEMQEIV